MSFLKLISYWDSISDDRVRQWPLTDLYSPWIILFAYIWSIKKLPGYFAKRKVLPDSLRLVILVYNLSMILLNGYIVGSLVLNSYRARYNYLCQETVYSHTPHEHQIAFCVYLFYISKVVELLDTLFFIIRNKLSHVTFLHIYHHSTMPLFCWLGVKWFAGGTTIVPICVNASVHIIMYAYYAIASFGDRMQPYLWWKRYLTKLQLTQFIGLMLFGMQYVYNDCKQANKVFIYLGFLYGISMIALFLNFYRKTYFENMKPFPCHLQSQECQTDCRPTKSRDQRRAKLVAQVSRSHDQKRSLRQRS